MNSRTTWTLLFVAVGLGAFIFFFEQHLHTSSEIELPGRVLPDLKISTVSGIIVRPAQRIEINAQHTNNTWQLVKPISYPASAQNIEALLVTFSQIKWNSRITASELKDRPDYSHEFGFDPPQFSLAIQHDKEQWQLLVGSLTPLRDQVFLQVVGRDEIYLVPAGLLQFLPRVANDWRDATLADLKTLAFDRITVTNGAKTFELRREATGNQWRVIVHSLEARADGPKIEHLLEQFQSLHFSKFISDDPKADLENFGLEPPELEIQFARGEEPLLALQFGKAATNSATQIYARRADTTSIGLVAKEQLAAWRGSFEDFRDRHLVTLTSDSVDEVEVKAAEQFTLRRLTNGLWRIVSPYDLPADPALVREAIGTLSSMQIVSFVKSVVTEPDLPSYGLSPATSQYTLRTRSSNDVASATNSVIAQLNIGATTNGTVYVRRSDESAVYAVRLADIQNLPTAGWQMRERQIWNFTEDEVAKLNIRENGKILELQHNGTNQWAFTSGSQGIINNFAIEEVAGSIGGLSAAYWSARGETNRAQLGFTDDTPRITIDLKQSDKIEMLTLELGGTAPSGLRYGATKLDGELWFFELPARISELIHAYLTIPGRP